MKTTLYLVRPAALLDVATPWQGHGAAQARPGVRQAELTRDLLAVRPIDACYCGPAARAEQTAAILAAPHGLRPQVLAALDEGHDAAAAFASLLERHAGDTVLVVAPRAVLAVYLAVLLRMTPEQAERARLDRGGVTVVVRDGDVSAVTTLNAVFHLQGVAA